MRVFPTTSVGRLFDTVAALVGFTRPVTFEGQAALWLEHLARRAPDTDIYPMPYADGVLDYRPMLAAVVDARRRGDDPGAIARAFHRGLARAAATAVLALAESQAIETVVFSGGVFQNLMLVSELTEILERQHLSVWCNREVPANDGGISLGQAALAAVAHWR